MLLKEQLDLGEPSLLGGHNSITKMGGERYHPKSQTFDTNKKKSRTKTFANIQFS